MAQKLILLEGDFGKDLLAHHPLAEVISLGYEVTSVSGFATNDNKSMAYVLLETPIVEAPVFDPVSKSFEESCVVSISCPTAGASIYYTTDGTAPTSSSTAYSGSIAVTATTTIKAIAVKNGISSAARAETYTKAEAAAAGEE